MAVVSEAGSPRSLEELMPGTRLKVLKALSAEPRRSLSITELIERLHSGRGAVQREVARLVKCGLLRSSDDRKRRHYAFNTANPLARALLPFLGDQAPAEGPVADVPETVASALSPFADRFRFCAVVDDVEADATVAIVVGEEVDEAYLQQQLREVCATRLLSPTDFVCGLKEGSPLIERAVHGPHHALIRPQKDDAVVKTPKAN